MSENEAILKLMVPYGDKSNNPSMFSYPIKDSEGKYSIGHVSINTNADSQFTFNMITENRITIVNNLYSYAPSNTNTVGFLSQNINWQRYGSIGNGYGTLFQDNYEDKPEIRCYTYAKAQRKNSNFYLNETLYNRNGDACSSKYIHPNSYSSTNQTRVITYKTSTMQYQGMFPVFSPLE